MNGDGAIDCVMRARPDLFVPLAALLDTNTDRTVPEFLETLATQEPESFSVLMQVVAGAYYLDDGVRKTIGYNGQRAIPLSDIALASPAFEGHTTRKHQRFRSI
ncbi:hypothetical protein [Acidisoma cladoniae]|uniref:hypothetical protein n=1 Tax=Acidisoma cladoniae TaxID=3040935 RepID=UPI00254FEF16|nr:hypothetical protein [Acidisoma sp. PAMC 29798]